MAPAASDDDDGSDGLQNGSADERTGVRRYAASDVRLPEFGAGQTRAPVSASLSVQSCSARAVSYDSSDERARVRPSKH